MEPSVGVLEAFGVCGSPIPLPGGQRTTFRVGDIVLKPAQSEVEAIWVIEVLDGIVEDAFRVPHFLSSDTGELLVDGWMAYEFLPGKMVQDHWIEKREVLERFHWVLKDVPFPPFFAHRDDPWALADFMVWGEMPISCHARLKPAVEKLVGFLEPIEVTNQIIQGDPDNILFAENFPPAIIDFCPYWRPANFALAVLVVDKLVWSGADESIVQVFADIPEFPQLLIRAELRRVLEIDGHFHQFGKDCLDEVDAHLPTIGFICSLAQG
ncbi:MAG: TIGR02569 family protein [Promethearchaeota archaeon]